MSAMKLAKFRLCVVVALSFAAGSLATAWLMRTEKVQAAGNRVYELRVYHTNPGKLPNLQTRFRDHTRAIFEKHGMKNVAYWTPQDSPASDNTLIYIISHPSRDDAKKNWAAFQADAEWQKVAKESEVGGKIIDHLESTFMVPTDYSPLK